MTGHRPWRELRAQLVERVGEEKLAEGAARVREAYDAAQADADAGRQAAACRLLAEQAEQAEGDKTAERMKARRRGSGEGACAERRIGGTRVRQWPARASRG